MQSLQTLHSLTSTIRQEHDFLAHAPPGVWLNSNVTHLDKFTSTRTNHQFKSGIRLTPRIKNKIHVSIKEPVKESPKETNKEICEEKNEEIHNDIKYELFLKKEVQELKTLLAVECAKSEIWQKLLENNTNIKVGNIVTGISSYSINFFPVKTIDIEVILNKYIENVKTTYIESYPTIEQPIENKKLNCGIEKHTDKTETNIKISQEKQDTSNNSYRTAKGIVQLFQSEVKNCVDENEEDNEDMEAIEDNNEYFTGMFEKLKTTRNYIKIVTDIKNRRLKAFKMMDLDNYTKLIKQHYRDLDNIFKSKKFVEKKIYCILSKALSSLECRLLELNININMELDVDEMQTFFTVLKNTNKNEKTYLPYSENNIGFKFHNYGLLLFPISKMLDLYLNMSGYNNVIYLPLPKSSKEDPYSFYTLDKIFKDKRLWSMDCRLEDFSIGLSRSILPYGIAMFRKMYKLVFGDNDYRDNFSSKYQLTEGELEQLLLNILLMSNNHKFRILLQNKIINLATHIPSENDKFNLYGDDSLQRKRLQQETDDPEAVDILRQLFDNISTQQMVDLYRSKVT